MPTVLSKEIEHPIFFYYLDSYVSKYTEYKNLQDDEEIIIFMDSTDFRVYINNNSIITDFFHFSEFAIRSIHFHHQFYTYQILNFDNLTYMKIKPTKEDHNEILNLRKLLYIIKYDTCLICQKKRKTNLTLLYDKDYIDEYGKILRLIYACIDCSNEFLFKD